VAGVVVGVVVEVAVDGSNANDEDEVEGLDDMCLRRSRPDGKATIRS
jgi:hypothetical protein